MSIPQRIKDYRLKPLQQYYRPYFSPYTNSYEIDYVFIPNFEKPQVYLACININTKYLFMIPVKRRSIADTDECITQINSTIAKQFPGSSIQHIRGDADSAFGKVVEDEGQTFPGLHKDSDIVIGNMRFRNNIFTKHLYDVGIGLFLSRSPFTNKNRVIDRVIRTIRDRLGENYLLFNNPKIIAKVVEEYNNTPHSAFNHEFTPFQVQSDQEIEEYYIRQQMKRLDEVKKLQEKNEFFNYKPGNVLLIHLSFAKTKDKLRKRRRVFNRLAIFDSYVNGNVRCSVLERNEDGEIDYVNYERIVIPIFYTKFLCEDEKRIPEKYKQLIL